jgi:hypothetical protein
MALGTTGVKESMRGRVQEIHTPASSIEKIRILEDKVNKQAYRIKELEAALAISEKNATMDSMLTGLLNK